MFNHSSMCFIWNLCPCFSAREKTSPLCLLTCQSSRPHRVAAAAQATLHAYLQEAAYRVSDTYRIRYVSDTPWIRILEVSDFFIIFTKIGYVGWYVSALWIRPSPKTHGTYACLRRPNLELALSRTPACCASCRIPIRRRRIPCSLPASAGHRRRASVPARRPPATSFLPCDVDPGNSCEFILFSVLFSISSSSVRSLVFLSPF